MSKRGASEGRGSDGGPRRAIVRRETVMKERKGVMRRTCRLRLTLECGHVVVRNNNAQTSAACEECHKALVAGVGV